MHWLSDVSSSHRSYSGVKKGGGNSEMFNPSRFPVLARDMLGKYFLAAKKLQITRKGILAETQSVMLWNDAPSQMWRVTKLNPMLAPRLPRVRIRAASQFPLQSHLHFSAEKKL